MDFKERYPVMVVAKHRKVARMIANELDGLKNIDGKDIKFETSYTSPNFQRSKYEIRSLFNDYFSIICFYIAENSEMQTILPLLEIYAVFPIKIILHEPHVLIPKDQAPNVPRAVKTNMTAFIKTLYEEREKLNTQLTNTFKSLDKDNSGYIDIEELILAGKQMGINMTREEAETTLDKIDRNGDKMISLEEFAYWWNSGRKLFGLSLRETMVGKIKSSNFARESREVLESVGKSLDNSKVNGLTHIGLNKEDGQTQLLLRAATYGPEYNEIKKVYCPKFSDGIDVTLVLNCRDGIKAKESIEQIVEAVISLITMMQPRHLVSIEELKPTIKTRGNSVLVEISLAGSGDIEAEREYVMQLMAFIFPMMRLSGQSVMAKLRLATDFGALTTEKKPIFTHIINGVSLEVRTQIMKKNVDILNTFLTKYFPDRILIIRMIMQVIVFGDIDIKLKVEDKLQEGMIKDILEEFSDLKQEFPHLKEQIRDQAKEQYEDSPPFIRLAIDLFRDQVESLEIAGVTEDLALSLFAVLPGLDKLLNLD